MKYLFCFAFYTVILIYNCSPIFAKDYSTSIIVFGTAEKYEEAKNMALRSACEQAYGVFLSSKSTLLNDEIIVDDLTTISNGIVKSYDVISKEHYPDGRWGVILSVNVSIENLATFLQSKGESVSFNGELLVFNIKQKFLKKDSEFRIVAEMFGMLHELMQVSFDYAIENSLPKNSKYDNSKWELLISVKAKANSNIDICAGILIKTLTALSLKEEEIKEYSLLNLNIYGFGFQYKDQRHNFNFRNHYSIRLANTFFSNWEYYVRRFQADVVIDENSTKASKDKYIIDLSNKKNKIFSIEGDTWFKQKGHMFSFNNEFEPDVMTFLTSGSEACKFISKNIITLEILEKIIGFKVKPIGVESEFKYGGYVVDRKDGNVLVAAICDFYTDKKDPHTMCNELLLCGYKDWRLPSVEDMKLINEKLFLNQIGNYSSFDQDWYLTDDLVEGNWEKKKDTYEQECIMFSFKYGKPKKTGYYDGTFLIPVRRFKEITSEVFKSNPTFSDSIHHKNDLLYQDNYSDNELIHTDLDYDYNEVISRLLPDLLRKVEYPEMARRSGIEGKVIVKVLIGKDGRPKQGKTIIVETADELLNDAAIKAIMAQVFPPAVQYGQPIEIWASIPIVFRVR